MATKTVQSRGFTLIELLVVMLIITLLIGLLVPGVQRAREASRRTSCLNNLHQVALAVANHEAQKTYYPSSWKPTLPDATGAVDGWSAFGQLLPHLEQGNLYSRIDFNVSYRLNSPIVTADGASTKIGALRVPTYLCPSERRDEVRFESGVPTWYPISYGVNLGTWLVYDPTTEAGGDGVFYPKSRLRQADLSDGPSMTLCAAEVKAWQPHYRNKALATNPGIPTSGDICTLAGGEFRTESGHTEWVDGRANQTGFTTVFRPNTRVLCTVSGTEYDVDWTNQQEGKSTTVPTWAAITSRSHHQGVVNAALMDGSVRSFADDIDLNVWRAYATRNGHEIMPSKDQPR